MHLFTYPPEQGGLLGTALAPVRRSGAAWTGSEGTVQGSLPRGLALGSAPVAVLLHFVRSIPPGPPGCRFTAARKDLQQGGGGVGVGSLYWRLAPGAKRPPARVELPGPGRKDKGHGRAVGERG